jgi:class 3 adenylate cyclase/TolB-like protein
LSDRLNPTNEQRIHRALSLNESSPSALRAASLREAGVAPEGLAAVGRENPLAGPVRGDVDETENPARVRDGAPAGLRMAENPSDLTRGRYILRVGEVPRLEAPSVERKLAAIFAADVEGYSRLMGRDEVGTLRTLTAYRVIIDRLIASHRGRIFNTAGDSLVADFASAVDAVQCAVAVQDAISKENADRPAGEHMQFRIGIHVGDIIVQGDDIYGDGVNVAARLEALAEPGEICISRMVRDQIRDKLAYAFRNLGEQSVKNIARPVRVYALRPEAVADLPTPSTSSLPPISSPAVAPRLSIVVLPFANLSGDPEQQYFADGITEDLTTELSRIAGMLVISRNTAFTYRNKAIDTKQIGRELGVRYVLEGSIRRSANQIRINAQLIDAETGSTACARPGGRIKQPRFLRRDKSRAGSISTKGGDHDRPADHHDQRHRRDLGGRRGARIASQPAWSTALPRRGKL